MVTRLAQALADATLYEVGALEVVLVRHGQQIPPAERTSSQMSDPPLSSIGERQIEAVSDHLAGERVDAVYCSDLVRAHRTGTAIASRHALDAVVVEELREVDFRHRLPEGTTLQAVTEQPSFDAAAQRFADSGKWSDLPMAEPSVAFRDRVGHALEGIIERHRDDARVVVACHGGVVNAYVAEILGIERDFWFRTAHCSANRVLALDDRRRVWRINESHHLDNGLFTA